MSQWLGFINNWFRSQPHDETNPAERLAQLWNDQEAGQHIAFMSVVLNVDGPSAYEIHDLGLSIWRKAGLVHSISKHWRIEDTIETKDVVEFGTPDSFDFGSTQPIKAGDVRTVLDDWVLSVARECEQVCLVVYGKQQTKALWKNWRPPVPVVFLDIEVVWRSRNNGPADATFEEVGSGIGAVADATRDIAHAGNQAHCLLILVRALARRAEILPRELRQDEELYG